MIETDHHGRRQRSSGKAGAARGLVARRQARAALEAGKPWSATAPHGAMSGRHCLAEMSEQVGGLDQETAHRADRMDMGFIQDRSSGLDGVSAAT